MKITSRASDYAILMLISLAKEEAMFSNVKRIAAELKISLRFLAAIANKLTAAKITSATRGQGGGIRLARTPETISIRDVIEAVDGPIQTMFCQNTDDMCTREPMCSVKHVWDDIQTWVTARLAATTLRDLRVSSPHEATHP